MVGKYRVYNPLEDNINGYFDNPYNEITIPDMNEIVNILNSYEGIKTDTDILMNALNKDNKLIHRIKEKFPEVFL